MHGEILKVDKTSSGRVQVELEEGGTNIRPYMDTTKQTEKPTRVHGISRRLESESSTKRKQYEAEDFPSLVQSRICT